MEGKDTFLFIFDSQGLDNGHNTTTTLTTVVFVKHFIGFGFSINGLNSIALCSTVPVWTATS